MGYRVVVKGGDDRRYQEGPANSAITPGMLIQKNVANANGSVDPATIASSTFKKVDVAIEQMYLSGGPQDAYAVGAQVLYQSLLNGDQFFANVASGTGAITYGQYLALDPANPGCLVPYTNQAWVVGRALQANPANASGALQQVRVEVI